MNLENKIFNIRKYSRSVVRELGLLQYDKIYMGLLPSQGHALLEIEDKGAITSIGLSELLRLDKSTVSRIVKELEKKGLIKTTPNPSDSRSKLLSCTEEGLKLAKVLNAKSNNQVQNALNLLSTDEQNMIEQGMMLYSKALNKARLRSEYTIRPIELSDNEQLSALIKSILNEFGAAREGFAFQDDSLNNMYAAYKGKGSCYYVVCKGKQVLGGTGIAELAGGDKNICELQKMYLSKELRGLGLGQTLMEILLNEAKKLGYDYCYLETLASMEGANRLYNRYGFRILSAPLGNTGHFGCDSWYLKEL
jgi:putative acetyltransferase